MSRKGITMSGTRSADAELFARLLDPAVRHDPYPVYALIRDLGPLWIEHMPAAVVAGYADCEALLRDPRLSAERWRYAGSTVAEDDIPWDAPVSLYQPSFLSLDPPDHTRMRRLVAKAFNATAVAKMETEVASLVSHFLDQAAETDTFDVVRGLAYPLPVTVICRLLGVPVADEHLFHSWSVQLTRFVDGLALAAAASETETDWLPGMIEMHRYVEELVALRRARPRDDLISELLAIEDAGDTLSEEELASTIVLLLVTGHETTVNLIGNGVLALLRHREHWDRLREDPSTVAAVLEEVLRYDPPVQMAARVATQSIRLGDREVGAGDLVFLLIAAAHRDPAANPDPDRFDPRRTSIRHLAFGLGPHYCIGAPLAKLQGRLVFTELARRLVEPALAQDPPPYRENLNLHVPSSLPLTHRGLLR